MGPRVLVSISGSRSECVQDNNRVPRLLVRACRRPTAPSALESKERYVLALRPGSPEILPRYRWLTPDLILPNPSGEFFWVLHSFDSESFDFPKGTDSSV